MKEKILDLVGEVPLSETVEIFAELFISTFLIESQAMKLDRAQTLTRWRRMHKVMTRVAEKGLDAVKRLPEASNS